MINYCIPWIINNLRLNKSSSYNLICCINFQKKIILLFIYIFILFIQKQHFEQIEIISFIYISKLLLSKTLFFEACGVKETLARKFWNFINIWRLRYRDTWKCHPRERRLLARPLSSPRYGRRGRLHFYQDARELDIPTNTDWKC